MATSVTYEAARVDKEATLAGSVEITFPAFDDLPALTLKYATMELDLDGSEFKSKLGDLPHIRQQRGAAQDSADFSINDPKAEVYDQIRPYEDVLEDTQVICRESYKTSLGIFESETTLIGAISSMNVTESSQQLSFSVVSDMSKTGYLIGGRIIAARYCAAVFNKNGLKDPQYDPCGWIEVLGGNPIFCSHKRKGTDGCKEHGNEARFFAVEALTDAQVTYTGGGGGFGYGGGQDCFHPMTEVWMADGSFKPIYQIEIGDIVWGWTPDGKRRKSRVGHVEKNISTQLMNVDFGKNRILMPTVTHPVNTQHPNVYKCFGAIDVGEPIRHWSSELQRYAETVFRNDWFNGTRTRTHNFHSVDTENYHVRCGDLIIPVSNNKPIDIHPILT